jgi:hypothetical protein
MEFTKSKTGMSVSLKYPIEVEFKREHDIGREVIRKGTKAKIIGLNIVCAQRAIVFKPEGGHVYSSYLEYFANYLKFTDDIYTAEDFDIFAREQMTVSKEYVSGLKVPVVKPSENDDLPVVKTRIVEQPVIEDDEKTEESEAVEEEIDEEVILEESEIITEIETLV